MFYKTREEKSSAFPGPSPSPNPKIFPVNHMASYTYKRVYQYVFSLLNNTGTDYVRSSEDITVYCVHCMLHLLDFVLTCTD